MVGLRRWLGWGRDVARVREVERVKREVGPKLGHGGGTPLARIGSPEDIEFSMKLLCVCVRARARVCAEGPLAFMEEQGEVSACILIIVLLLHIHTHWHARAHTHTHTHTHTQGQTLSKKASEDKGAGWGGRRERERERESQNARCGRMPQDELEGHPRTNTTPKDEADKRREPEKLTMYMTKYVYD
jgi:hypothetical protein